MNKGTFPEKINIQLHPGAIFDALDEMGSEINQDEALQLEERCLALYKVSKETSPNSLY